MTAEFFGTDFQVDPGPRSFVKARGLRKFCSQSAFRPDGGPDGSPALAQRAYEMTEATQRAIRWFLEQEHQGVRIQWHTLQFSVERTGMEDLPDSELWRWEVWAQ